MPGDISIEQLRQTAQEIEANDLSGRWTSAVANQLLFWYDNGRFVPIRLLAHVLDGFPADAPRDLSRRSTVRQIEDTLASAEFVSVGAKDTLGENVFGDYLVAYSRMLSTSHAERIEKRRNYFIQGRMRFWAQSRAESWRREAFFEILERLDSMPAPDIDLTTERFYALHPRSGRAHPYSLICREIEFLYPDRDAGSDGMEALKQAGIMVLDVITPGSDVAFAPNKLADVPERLEGATIQITRNEKERSRAARLDAEAYWRNRHNGRLLCEACLFDFELVYGDRGKGFIHFHHRNPLSGIIGERTIRADVDLVPLCPNCHAISHRGEPTLDEEGLRNLMAQERARRS